MSQLNFGQDIISVLVVIGLISVFILVLEDTVVVHRKSEERAEALETLMNISERVRNNFFVGNLPGDGSRFTDSRKSKKLSRFLDSAEFEGKDIRIEVISFSGEPLFGVSNDDFDPLQSLSLPVVWMKKGKRIPAKVNILVGE